jgi:hypothetical protein
VSQHLRASLSNTSHKSTRAQSESACSIHEESSNRKVHTNSTPAKSSLQLADRNQSGMFIIIAAFCVALPVKDGAAVAVYIYL